MERYEIAVAQKVAVLGLDAAFVSNCGIVDERVGDEHLHSESPRTATDKPADLTEPDDAKVSGRRVELRDNWPAARHPGANRWMRREYPAPTPEEAPSCSPRPRCWLASPVVVSSSLRSRSAGRSTLSTPTPWRAMIFSRGAPTISRRVIRPRRSRTPSASDKRSSSSSSGNVWGTTSTDPTSRSISIPRGWILSSMTRKRAILIRFWYTTIPIIPDNRRRQDGDRKNAWMISVRERGWLLKGQLYLHRPAAVVGGVECVGRIVDPERVGDQRGEVDATAADEVNRLPKLLVEPKSAPEVDFPRGQGPSGTSEGPPRPIWTRIPRGFSVARPSESACGLPDASNITSNRPLPAA